MAKNIEEYLKKAEESLGEARIHRCLTYVPDRIIGVFDKYHAMMAQYYMAEALYQQNQAIIELLKEKK